MISGATNKISLYSQLRHFANGFRPGRPAAGWPLLCPRPAPVPSLKKFPRPGTILRFGLVPVDQRLRFCR